MIILAIDTSCDDTSIAIVEADKSRIRAELGAGPTPHRNEVSGAGCGLTRGFTRMNFKILSNIISSQVKVHRKYGGVFPTLAKREHQRNLVPVLKESLRRARLLKSKRALRGEAKGSNKDKKLKIDQNLNKILKREPVLARRLEIFFEKYQRPKIDLIAITVGPGLEPCLWVGVNFARALGYFWRLPILPINHIEAHIYANWLTPISIKSKSKDQKSKIQIKNEKIIFPALYLIASGGHTQLILMRNHGEYSILGETRDDAAGECFDKGAKILGLEYPGGPIIERQAAKLQATSYPPASASGAGEWRAGKLQAKLPRPMIYQKNYDFSFSGLKTAILYDFKSRPKKTRKSKKYIQEMSYEIQEAIIDVLIYKTLRAAKDHKVKTIMLGGGVTANSELRKQFQLAINNQQSTIKFLVPPKILCTDNAVMIAMAGYFNWFKKGGRTWKNIKANANLRIA